MAKIAKASGKINGTKDKPKELKLLDGVDKVDYRRKQNV